MALVAGIGALAGVLIWAKLRLVSNVPRSVYADPKARAVLPREGDRPRQEGTPRGAAGAPASPEAGGDQKPARAPGASGVRSSGPAAAPAR